jgi:cell division septum initiation protein DivIVA
LSVEHPNGAGERETATPVRRFPRSRINSEDRDRLREANFPIAIRGYDRDAVDRYVKNTNRVIAELEISSSPEAAVRHALEEVSEETRGLLERAHETSEEITARSRARADDRVQAAEKEAEQIREAAAREADELRSTAKRQAEDMRVAAETRVAELDREADELWGQRRRLIKDMRAVAQEQLEIADAAAARFAREPDAPTQEP